MTTKTTRKTEYTSRIVPEMQKLFGYKNVMAVPRVTKVVINIGIGKIQDKKEREALKHTLSMIAGQIPDERKTTKAISQFKTREGMVVGYRTTIRGHRMEAFLERFIHAALPRTRDFRGITESSVDEHGNLHIGVREHIIFPELIGEDFQRIYSLQVSVVTNARTKGEAHKLFELMGFPFERPEA
jgi:large subunit ribosomal protein L5